VESMFSKNIMNLQNFARVIFSINNIHKTYNFKERAKSEDGDDEDSTTQGLLKKLNQIEQSISSMIELRKEWLLIEKKEK